MAQISAAGEAEVLSPLLFPQNSLPPRLLLEYSACLYSLLELNSSAVMGRSPGEIQPNKWEP